MAWRGVHGMAIVMVMVLFLPVARQQRHNAAVAVAQDDDDDESIYIRHARQLSQMVPSFVFNIISRDAFQVRHADAITGTMSRLST